MSTAEKTQWQITGHEIVCCNCDWGCPCQFNAPPTTGNCEAFIGYEIADGHYGATTLDGARWAAIYHWPGRIDEGDGTRQIIIDERVDADQRAALEELVSGTQGGAYFEIFASVAPNQRPTATARIEMQSDPDRRVASLTVSGFEIGRASCRERG